MDSGADSLARPALAHPYEIDEWGNLTAERKEAYREYFRIAERGTGRGRPRQNDEAETFPQPDTETLKELVELHKRDPDAARFVEYVNSTTQALEAYGLSRERTEASRQILDLRADFLKQLRDTAERFLKEGGGSDALRQACEDYGAFRGCERTIKDASEKVVVKEDKSRLAHDIEFRTSG